MKITLPAEQVMHTTLYVLRCIMECDGNELARLAEEYYPIPDDNNNTVKSVFFNSEDDTLTIEYENESAVTLD